MKDDTPLACSLDAAQLERRLASMAAAGAEHLITHDTEGGLHVLRFRAEDGARRRLDEIVEVEKECCPFLDLLLTQAGNELVLSIGAPEHAEGVAAGLAEAFAQKRRQ